VFHRRLDFPCELDHRVDFLVALFALLAQRLERIIHRDLAGQVVVDEMLGDREPCLDRLFAGPVLAMGLALDLKQAASSVRLQHKEQPPPSSLGLTKICLTPIPPYQRSRIASAPSVFSRRPMYKSSLSLSVAVAM
jgi:hypothetical protein